MKEINTNYYQQLLDKGRFDISDRKFYQSVLNSVKRQGNKATERQYNIVIQIKNGKPLYSTKNEYIYKQNFTMKNNKLAQLIRESIQEYIKEIDAAGDKAALEAKITKTQEAIDLRKKKINMEGLDEAFHDMMDKGKVKELTSEIKMLEKSLTKYGKMLEKMESKVSGASDKPIEKVEAEEEVIDEVNIEDDPESGPQLEGEDMATEETNIDQVYEVLLMQKRAGLISESKFRELKNKK